MHLNLKDAPTPIENKIQNHLLVKNYLKELLVENKTEFCYAYNLNGWSHKTQNSFLLFCLKPNLESENNRIINDYMIRHFAVAADSKSVAYKFVGFEKDKV